MVLNYRLHFTANPCDNSVLQCSMTVMAMLIATYFVPCEPFSVLILVFTKIPVQIGNGFCIRDIRE